MGGSRSVVARVRALLLRASEGTLEPSVLAAHAGDLLELKSRLARLAALGLEAELAPEVDALLAAIQPAAVAA